jgi:uncharacterized membrane protein YfcA
MADAAFLVAVVAVTFLLAGLVKGVIGMGLPTLAMGILSVVMPPAEAAAILVVPTVITNIWQMVAGPALTALVRRLALMIVGAAVGTFATIGLLTGTSTSIATGALGAVLAAYGIQGLIGIRFDVRRESERWLSPVVGLITGMLTGATGVFVIPAVPYLNSLRLEKEELMQSIGISAFVCPVALGLALAVNGQLQPAVAMTSFLALLPALAGMYVGQYVRVRLQPAVFRRWFFSGLTALGGYMVLRSVRHAYV